MANVPIVHALWAVALALFILAGSIVFATVVSLHQWWKEEKDDAHG
jgi:hypothetical protein